MGDVHGCVRELRAVLKRAVQEADHLVFLGDYVDRGPASRTVLDELVDVWRASPDRTTFLRGNHDAAFLRVIETGTEVDTFLKMGGAKTIRSYLASPYRDAIERLRAAVPDAHRQFLSSLEDAYSGADVVAVHDPRDAPDDGRFVVAGHAAQSDLVPLITEQRALIDTGCGTRPGGRLTCFLWPTRKWWQSNE